LNGRSPAFLVALVVLGLLFPAVVGPGVFRAPAGGTAAAATKSSEDKDNGEARDDGGATDASAPTCSAGELPVVGSCTVAFVDRLREFLPGGDDAGSPTATASGCRALPALENLRFLVVTVPDPVASGLRSFYDETIDAVVSAIEAAGAGSRDRFWLPWGAGGSGSGVVRGETCAEQLPGLLLFRATSTAAPLVVLVVGETPTWGIHRAAFERALGIAAGSSQTHVSVLGPTFSGSAPSLRNAIEAWKRPDGAKVKDLPTFDVLSGSATSPENRPRFAGAARITYDAVPPDDDHLQQAFYGYLQSQMGVETDGASLRHVALLTESGTAYGDAAARSGKTDGGVADESSPRQKYAPERIERFPLHMASVRAEYQSAQRTGGSAPPLLQQTSLDPKFDDPTRRLDTPSVLSPSTTVSQDLILSRTIDAFAQQGIRFVGVAATDPADVVFITQYVRQRHPDLRIFLLDGDILYTHPSVVASTRGALLVTPYPLTPSLVAWSFPLARSALTASAKETSSDVLPNTASEGIFLATQELIKTLTKPRPKPDPKVDPDAAKPIWISAVGSDGAWPVDIRNPLPAPASADRAKAGSIATPVPTAPAVPPASPVPPGRAAFVLGILGFCLWQIAAIYLALASGARFEDTHWPAPLRPYRAFALLGPPCPRRTSLAALAIGVIDAIALLVLWLYRLRLGPNALYDLGPAQTWISVVALLLIGAGSLRALPHVFGKIPRRPTWLWPAPLLAWALPWVAVVVGIGELVRPGSREADVWRVLLLLRSVAVGSNVSPLTPLLLLAGVPYLFAWLHLERMRVGRGLLRVRQPRWKAGALVGTAAITLVALAVLFESKTLSTLEGPFGDRTFGVLLTLAALVVTTTYGWMVLLWMDLHAFLKTIHRRYDPTRIEAAMRRLPTALSGEASAPLAPVPEEKDEKAALKRLAGWLFDNRRDFDAWRDGSALFAGPTAKSVRIGSLWLLRLLWDEPSSRWPSTDGSSSAAAWIEKAEERIAGHLAVRIHPMVSQIRALLALGVGSTLLWSFALGSYVFEPERLLTTVVSVVLVVFLLSALLMFVELERNAFISALAKTKAEITWRTFLSNTLTWVVLPFLAFLAVQYPAAANQVMSWLQPAVAVLP
jgi:hypothetical protein